jgi:hypothetical protein
MGKNKQSSKTTETKATEVANKNNDSKNVAANAPSKDQKPKK